MTSAPDSFHDGQSSRSSSPDSDALIDVLHRTQFGIIITPGSGRPTFVNQYADHVLEGRDGLAIADAGLEALRASDTRALRAAVTQAARRELANCVTLQLPRTKHVHALVVHIPAPTYSTRENLAAVFVCDPDRESAIGEPSLQRLYGLTRAEASIAVLLTRGKTLEQIATTTFISLHTARTHLKRILLKTDTGRQAELLRLLLTCSGQVRLD